MLARCSRRNQSAETHGGKYSAALMSVGFWNTAGMITLGLGKQSAQTRRKEAQGQNPLVSHLHVGLPPLRPQQP